MTDIVCTNTGRPQLGGTAMELTHWEWTDWWDSSAVGHALGEWGGGGASPTRVNADMRLDPQQNIETTCVLASGTEDRPTLEKKIHARRRRRTQTRMGPTKPQCDARASETTGWSGTEPSMNGVLHFCCLNEGPTQTHQQRLRTSLRQTIASASQTGCTR